LAFSLFGKKPPPKPGTDASASGSPSRPAGTPGRLKGGIADAFRGGDSPGRFGNRAGARATGETKPGTYSYGPEFGANSVAPIGGASRTGASSRAPVSEGSSQLGPMTEAAFTRLPSDLDVGATPRRRASVDDVDKPQALDDCALSFANGQDAEALRRIEEAVVDESLGPWILHAWLMRFDLYEHLGLKAAFEAQAMEFAKRFERSPPVWPAEGRGADEDASGSVIPTVNITGQLNAASAAPLSALRKTVDRYSGVRLDFTRLQGTDRDGARYLLVTIQSLKRAGKMVKLGGEAKLLEQLRPSVTPGDRTGDATTWLLYLEVLELVGAQDEFEQVAIDYATTFEVSPPSWQRVAAKVVTVAPTVPPDDRFYMTGEVVAPADRILAELEAHAARHPVLVVDMSGCRRLDFVTCSQLTNLLGKLQADGKPVEIRSPNEMIATLLGMMGADEVARVVPRRG
jgi:anti-anti-sigma regulatory factor